jgi:hypothetical protein
MYLVRRLTVDGFASTMNRRASVMQIDDRRWRRGRHGLR